MDGRKTLHHAQDSARLVRLDNRKLPRLPEGRTLRRELGSARGGQMHWHTARLQSCMDVLKQELLDNPKKRAELARWKAKELLKEAAELEALAVG